MDPDDGVGGDVDVVSPRNSRIARVAALLRDPRRRRAEGVCVVEGDDLVAAALAAGATLEQVLVDAERPPLGPRPWTAPPGVPVLRVASAAMARLSLLGHPPRITAVLRAPAPSAAPLFARDVVLCGVGDPANVGAIVRTAAAFDVAGVHLTPGCADPYGPKALRAAMGATFRPGLVCGPASLEALAAAPGRPLLAAAVAAGGVRPEALPDGAVVVLGSERDGLTAGERALCDVAVTVPAHGFASLNVAAAAAVLAYELARAMRAGDVLRSGTTTRGR